VKERLHEGIMKLFEIRKPKHMTVAELMYENARKYPNKEAIVFGDIQMSYREADKASNRIANCLIDLGVKKGDKITLMVTNSEMFIIYYFGIVKAGGVVVPINTSFTLNEVKFIIKNCGSKYFIYNNLPNLSIEKLENAEDVQLLCAGDSETTSALDFNELISLCQTDRPLIEIDEDDLCSILYTSGTTGTPRGAMFTHRKIIYDASIIGALTHRFNYYSRSLIMMPMFHSAPLNNHVLGTLFVGGTVVVLSKFDVDIFFRTIQSEKVTHFFGPAIVYLSCIHSCDVSKYDLSSVQMFIMGGSPVLPKDLIDIIEKFQMQGRFMQVYGLTESGPSGCALFPEDIADKAYSIGIGGSFGTELALVDTQHNVITQSHVVGELAVFSESNMLAYYNDTSKTESTMADGWVLTGDLAKYEDDGYLCFVDRVKDIIITGGQNVYSKEVENVIMEHPDVREAVVFGVFNEEWGESVKAVISLVTKGAVSPREIKSYCKDKLAKFKQPYYVQIVDEIPHNQTGKILKHVVRELYCQPADDPLEV